MADEEVEDGNGQEPTSPIDESKNGSLVEFEVTPEEMAEEMEDEAALNGEDVEGTNGETDEGEGEPEGEGGASSEKIEQPSKDSKDALGKKSATDVGDGDEKESTKKQLDKQQCQKVKRLQCGRQFREIIGQRESKKEELEKREGDLRQRLDVLECSMPAVMVWNVWQRMAQGGPVPNLHRLMEKQFRAPAAGEVCCPRSPSQHYDCRVREIEAERKEAQRRLEEARELWLDKEAKLKDRREKLEEAKRIQEERKEKLERLTKEASELREALKKMDEEAAAEEEQMFAGACESGECGDMRCRDGWLRRVGSVESIKAMDVDCLARLRELAESELTMKKQIADLERREETYMRTLQHADEMWSKMDGDAADTLNGLQEQLDTKTNANQQLAARICELEDELEKLRARMALCRSELSKYVSAGKIDTLIGREDDYAETTDKMVGAVPRVVGKGAGRDGDLAEVRDKDTWATVDVSDKEVSPHLADKKTMEMTKYLAMMGSMEELYYDDDYGVCGPDYACYEDWPGTYGECSATDIASTPAISQKVSRRISQQETKLRGVIREVDVQDSSKFDEDSIEGESAAEMYEEVIEFKESEDDTMIKTAVHKDDVLVPLSKLQSWVDTVDSIRLGISKGSASSVVKEDVDTLAEEIAAYAGVKAKEVITEILPGLDETEVDEGEITEKVVEEFEADVEEEVETAPKVEALEEEPIMTTEVEPAVEPPVEVDVELAVEPVIEADVEADVELAVEPADEVAVELAVEPDVELAVEPADEVAVELAVEPADKVAVEPADKVAVELAVEPADEVAVELAVEPADEVAVELAIEPADESAVKLAVEPVSLVSDTVAPVEAVAEMKKPEEEVEKEKVEVEVKESPAESIEPAPEEVEMALEKDIVADEETKTILPIQQLTEEEEVEEEAPPIEVPAAEVTVEGEETKVDDEPSVDEDAIQEEVESESVEEIEVEKVLPIETEEIIADIGDEVLEELPEEPIPTELTEEKEEIEDTELAVPVEEPTTEIEAVEEEEQPVEPGVPAEISETITVKQEIPMEEVPLEEKIEEAVEEISAADEELLQMEEMAEIKEEIPVLEEEGIKDVEDIAEEITETVPSAAEVKPEIKKRPEVPIDSKIVAMPYLAVADIEEIKEEPMVSKALPCVCKQVAEPTPSPTLPPMQIIITHAETVQTVINTSTQTCTVRPTPKKASCQRSIETDTRDPDISARKMRWRMRPKNRCTVASSNVSLQTDKSLLVLRSTTQDPCSSGKRLLSNILQSLKPSQSTEEKEIRTINYGQKHQQRGKCNCCLCGKEKISSRAPPSFAKLSKARYQKTDQITQKGKSNYGMPKSGITDKWQTSQLRAACAPKSVKQFSDQGICTHATSSCKSKLRMSYKRTVRLEMKDQSCSAKLPKSKVPSTELKKDERLECSSTEVKRIDDERRKKCSTPRHTFDSPSTCMCTKTEKTPSGNILKQQICACGDSD